MKGQIKRLIKAKVSLGSLSRKQVSGARGTERVEEILVPG